ncbi:uncharacterized protein METZ01_LOCUS256644 [marine metagenome]|uniref:Uncharacterized protein n=1 Tax=marine metagenome TaxID=408172 RepID=A0A382IVN5_9ZZZZ
MARFTWEESILAVPRNIKIYDIYHFIFCDEDNTFMEHVF